jgi:hypothetical protein
LGVEIHSATAGSTHQREECEEGLLGQKLHPRRWMAVNLARGVLSQTPEAVT